MLYVIFILIAAITGPLLGFKAEETLTFITGIALGAIILGIARLVPTIYINIRDEIREYRRNRAKVAEALKRPF